MNSDMVEIATTRGLFKIKMFVAYMPSGRGANRTPARIEIQEMITELNDSFDWVYLVERYPCIMYRKETTRRKYCLTRELAEEWLRQQLDKVIADTRKQYDRARQDLTAFDIDQVCHSPNLFPVAKDTQDENN